MSEPVIIVRPQPGADATAKFAKEMGLEYIVEPLFEVQPASWRVPAADNFDALLIGSANAVRHAGEGLVKLTALPVFAVGEVTAEVAADAGLTVSATGKGGISDILPMVSDAGHKRILRLSGHHNVPAEFDGLSIDTFVVYEARSLPPSKVLLRQLAKGGVVLLHSARAARQLATSVDTAGLDRGIIAIAAFGDRIADAAATGWREVVVSEYYQDEALLAVASDICNKKSY